MADRVRPIKEVCMLFYNIVGKSEPMSRIYELIEMVAPTRATVLIVGETGTGKELIARAIHHNSARKDKPFIAVNCSAIADNLWESEMFGHEKGAFTGAMAMKKGRFEVADKGTFFLMKSLKCLRPFRSNYCGYYRRWHLNGLEEPGPSRWMCGSLRLPIKA